VSAGGDDSALTWYDELREAYRPDRLRVLLIAESPPDAGDGARRFFYSPRLSHDNLYRGVADAVYGHGNDIDVRDKAAVLARLQQDGFWLIDAVKAPINKKTRSERRTAIKAGVSHLVDNAVALAPELGVVICHSVVFELTAPALRSAGLIVLHDRPLPFPLGNWRAEFVNGFRAAVRERA
jgi:hypothetical protein